VKKNPGLASEFKKIYPEKFHSYLAYVQSQDTQKPSGQESNQANLPPEFQEKLSKVDKFIADQEAREREVEVSKHVQQLDKWEQTFTKKYELAEPSLVWTKVQSLIDSGKIEESAVDDKLVESVFKSVHENYKKKFDGYSKKMYETNQGVNRTASDIGKGGGVPGEGPKSLKLHEVADKWISDLNRR